MGSPACAYHHHLCTLYYALLWRASLLARFAKLIFAAWLADHLFICLDVETFIGCVGKPTLILIFGTCFTLFVWQKEASVVDMVVMGRWWIVWLVAIKMFLSRHVMLLSAHSRFPIPKKIITKKADRIFWDKMMTPPPRTTWLSWAVLKKKRGLGRWKACLFCK